MDAPTSNRIEDWAVGGYAGLAAACLLLSAGALSIDAPYVGIFVAVWLLGLTALAAVALSIVVLALNAKLVLEDVDADRLAVGCALLIPTALAGAFSVVFADNSNAAFLWFLGLGIVALVVAPLGLGYRVFGERVRDRV